jgi:hypothetical protein
VRAEDDDRRPRVGLQRQLLGLRDARGDEAEPVEEVLALLRRRTGGVDEDEEGGVWLCQDELVHGVELGVAGKVVDGECDGGPPWEGEGGAPNDNAGGALEEGVVAGVEEGAGEGGLACAAVAAEEELEGVEGAGAEGEEALPVCGALEEAHNDAVVRRHCDVQGQAALRILRHDARWRVP